MEAGGLPFRVLSETEKHYAQIEKEALAAMWACERLSSYLLGLMFTLEMDHKLLVSLLSTKALDQLPPRVLRFCLRLMRFDYDNSCAWKAADHSRWAVKSTC